MGSDIDKRKLKWLEDDSFTSSPYQRGGRNTLASKFFRVCKENPLVPLGITATVTALGLGLVSFVRGDDYKSQVFMRWRVGMQMFTVCALLGGSYVAYRAQAKAMKDAEAANAAGSPTKF